MNIDDVLTRLQYIADAPPLEHVGFHPEAVQTAKDAIALIQELSKKVLPPTCLGLTRLGALVYPILLAQEAGEISESKAAELLGKDIVSMREAKWQAIKAVTGMLEQLPSPLILLLDGTKAPPSSSKKPG